MRVVAALVQKEFLALLDDGHEELDDHCEDEGEEGRVEGDAEVAGDNSQSLLEGADVRVIAVENEAEAADCAGKADDGPDEAENGDRPDNAVEQSVA